MSLALGAGAPCTKNASFLHQPTEQRHPAIQLGPSPRHGYNPQGPVTHHVESRRGRPGQEAKPVGEGFGHGRRARTNSQVAPIRPAPGGLVPSPAQTPNAAARADYAALVRRPTPASGSGSRPGPDSDNHPRCGSRLRQLRSIRHRQARQGPPPRLQNTPSAIPPRSRDAQRTESTPGPP